MIYEVDQERIKKQLHYLHTCVHVMEKTLELKGDPVSTFAAARALHVAVECVIDIGDALIDGFIMRDPGGYLDIIDILEDEQVIPEAGVSMLKEGVRLRDRLMRHYVDVGQEELVSGLTAYPVYRRYIQWVKAFLQKDLGVTLGEVGSAPG